MNGPSQIWRVSDDHPDWTCIASLDKSQGYDVDITEIWRAADGTFQLVTASGCSCWVGEYDAEPFATLHALEQSMVEEDRKYNASPVARTELLTEARAVLA